MAAYYISSTFAANFLKRECVVAIILIFQINYNMKNTHTAVVHFNGERIAEFDVDKGSYLPDYSMTFIRVDSNEHILRDVGSVLILSNDDKIILYYDIFSLVLEKVSFITKNENDYYFKGRNKKLNLEVDIFICSVETWQEYRDEVEIEKYFGVN